MLGVQVAHALEAAYGVGLIAHGDLKPENILLRLAGRTEGVDFGIARISEIVSGRRPWELRATWLPNRPWGALARSLTFSC